MHIAVVIDLVEVVAWDDVRRGDNEHSVLLKLLINRFRRRLSLAQVCENQPQIFVGRIAPEPNLVAKRLYLGRLFHAFSFPVVFPAVIETPEVLSLYLSD
jgi:hypothetical protein